MFSMKRKGSHQEYDRMYDLYEARELELKERSSWTERNAADHFDFEDLKDDEDSFFN